MKKKKKVSIKRSKTHKEMDYHMQTFLIHSKNFSKKWDFKHHVIPPMSCSATYRLESVERGKKGFEDFGGLNFQSEDYDPVYIYDRLDEPVRGMLEENIAAAESTDISVTFVTGMAAISAALGVVLKSGDELIAHNTLYGCTNSLLQNWYHRYNIKTKFVDLKDPANLKRAIKAKTKCVYYETPSNPIMELINIREVSNIIAKANKKRSKEKKIVSIVDNTFSTPYCQRPIEQGADLVVHSLTKNIGGFGVDMGGVVAGPKNWLPELLLYRKDFGGVLPPKNAWPIYVYGLATLPVRIKSQIQSAYVIAEYLEKHPKIKQVFYPGLESFPQYEIARNQMIDYEGNFAPGFMMYFTLKGSKSKAIKSAERIENYIAKNAYCITLAVSLGQLRTLIESPTTMTHAVLSPEDKKRAGVTGVGLRLAVGLENPKDIIKDLSKAFDQI